MSQIPKIRIIMPFKSAFVMLKLQSWYTYVPLSLKRIKVVLHPPLKIAYTVSFCCRCFLEIIMKWGDTRLI